MNETVQILVSKRRHPMHHFMLSATILLGFILNSCGQDVQSITQEAPTPKIISSEVKPLIPASQSETAVSNDKISKDLGSEDLSPSERAEHKAFMAKRTEGGKAHSKAMRAWYNQDLESRGPKPKWKRTTLSEDESRRFWILQDKRQAFVYRSKYQYHVPKYLSENELNELVASYMKANKIERNIEQKMGRMIKFKGFNSVDLSPSEIEEYKTLRAKGEVAKYHRKAIFSKDERQRFGILKDKLQIAMLQKTFEQYVPKHLSQDELNELMSSYGKIHKIERKLELQKTESRIKSIELGRKFLESRELDED